MLVRLKKLAVIAAALPLFSLWSGQGSPKTSVPGGKGSYSSTGLGVSVSGGKIYSADISGGLRRLEEDIEDVEKKLGNAKPGSQSQLNLRQKRERLGLEMIHAAQEYFLEYRTNSSGKHRKLYMLWQNEVKGLQPIFSKIKGFPLAKRMGDIYKAMMDVRAGKEKYSGKVPLSNAAFLKEIQKQQVEALKEHHKTQKRNRPRNSKSTKNKK